MSGVFFVVCVPSKNHELSLNKNTNSLKVSIELKKKFDCPSQKKDSRKCKFVNTLSKDCRSKSVENIFKDRLNSNSESVRTKSAEIYSSNPELEAKVTDYPQHKYPLEKVLGEVLENLKITNAVWSVGKDNLYKQVTFCVASGRPCEDALRLLTESGIGVKSNSVVSVIPCSLYYQGDETNLSPKGNNETKIATLNSDDYQREATAWGRFFESAKPRLIMAQIVQTVKQNATLTFDFLVLLIIAALTAALALVENSIVILVASMLISPLMGPIMAGMFGTVINDKDLQKMGVFNELIGLLLCVLIGFLFGLTVGMAGNHWANGDWPTEEMISKGELRALWVGVMVALMSGAAIAIAILADYTGSLIGVAISVALLPPAVNAGLLWSLSVINVLLDSSLTFSRHYTPLWSSKPSVELAILGGISLCLTILNIICIFIAGLLVLKIKEVAPRGLKSSSQHPWNPLKIARDYQTLANEENGTIPGQIADEVMMPDELTANDLRRSWMRFSHFPCSDLQYGQQINIKGLNQCTWSPASNRISQPYRPTAQDLASVINQITVRRPRSRSHQTGSNWMSGVGGGPLNFYNRSPSSPVNSEIIDETSNLLSTKKVHTIPENKSRLTTLKRPPRFTVTQVKAFQTSTEYNQSCSSTH